MGSQSTNKKMSNGKAIKKPQNQNISTEKHSMTKSEANEKQLTPHFKDAIIKKEEPENKGKISQQPRPKSTRRESLD